MMGEDGREAPLELWGGIEDPVTSLADLDRIASLGVAALRYPAPWERIAPLSLGQPDWASTDAPLARLRELGVRPILGLVHHGSVASYTSPLDAGFPEMLARFARLVAERYPWVTDYTPVNEPLAIARFSGSADAFVCAVIHQCRGIVLAMEAIRTVTPGARLVQTEDFGDMTGTGTVPEQMEHEHRQWLTWDLLTGRVARGHPLYRSLLSCGLKPADLAFFERHACPPDVVGLNDVAAIVAPAGGVTGHEAQLRAAAQRYGLPVALTDVHLEGTRDERTAWFLDAWHGAQWARGRGAEVTAVTASALLETGEWDSLAATIRDVVAGRSRTTAGRA